MRRLFLSFILLIQIFGASSWINASRGSHSSSFNLSMPYSEGESGKVVGAILASCFAFKVGEIGFNLRWMRSLYYKLKISRYTANLSAEKFYFFKWRINAASGGNYWNTPKSIRDADHKLIIKFLIKDLDMPIGSAVFINKNRATGSIHAPTFVNIDAKGRDIFDGRVLSLSTMDAIAKSVNDEVVMLRESLIGLRKVSVLIGGSIVEYNSVIESNLLDACGIDSILRLDLLQSVKLQSAKCDFLKKYPYWVESFSYKHWVAKIFFDTAVAYARVVALQDKINKEIRNRRSAAVGGRAPKELDVFRASLNSFVGNGSASFTSSDLNTLNVEANCVYNRLLSIWPRSNVAQQRIIDDVDDVRESINSAIDDFNNNKRVKSFNTIRAQRSLFNHLYSDVLKEL